MLDTYMLTLVLLKTKRNSMNYILIEKRYKENKDLDSFLNIYSELYGLNELKINYQKSVHFLRECKSNEFKVIRFNNVNYPEEFKELKSPPHLFFLKGNEKCIKLKAFSIYISEKISEYGLLVSERVGIRISEKDAVAIINLNKSTYRMIKAILERKGRIIGIIDKGLNFYDDEIVKSIIQNGGCIVSLGVPFNNKNVVIDQEVCEDTFRFNLGEASIVIEDNKSEIRNSDKRKFKNTYYIKYPIKFKRFNENFSNRNKMIALSNKEELENMIDFYNSSYKSHLDVYAFIDSNRNHILLDIPGAPFYEFNTPIIRISKEIEMDDSIICEFDDDGMLQSILNTKSKERFVLGVFCEVKKELNESLTEETCKTSVFNCYFSFSKFKVDDSKKVSIRIVCYENDVSFSYDIVDGNLKDENMNIEITEYQEVIFVEDRKKGIKFFPSTEQKFILKNDNGKFVFQEIYFSCDFDYSYNSYTITLPDRELQYDYLIFIDEHRLIININEDAEIIRMKDKNTSTVYYFNSYKEMKEDYTKYVLTNDREFKFQRQNEVNRENLKSVINYKLKELYLSHFDEVLKEEILKDIKTEMSKLFILSENSMENHFYIESKYELIKSAIDEMEENHFEFKETKLIIDNLEIIFNIINSIELYYQEDDY